MEHVNKGKKFVPAKFLNSITNLCDVMVENSNDIIFGFDHEFRIILSNKRSEQWFNSNKEEMTGKHLHDLFPDIKEDDIHYLRNIQCKDQYYLKRFKKYGKVYDWHVFPLKDKFSKVIGVLSMIKDVSINVSSQNTIDDLSKQLSEKNLLLSNRANMAETIIDSSDDLIIVLDRNLSFCAANRSFLSYTGKTPEELIGKNLIHCFSHLETSELLGKIKSALLGEAVSLEKMPCTFKDGYCDISITPLSFHKFIYGVVIFAQDITEINFQSEELKRMKMELVKQNREIFEKDSLVEGLFSTTKDLVAVCDCNLKLLDINQSYSNYIQMEKNQVVGKSLMELFPDLKSRQIYHTILKALKGEPQLSNEYQYLRNSESGKVSIIPLKNQDNQVTKILFIGQH